MRLSHDLHEWHPGPVEIDEADLYPIRIGAVNEPSSVFLDVDTSDAGSPRLAPGNELEMSVNRQRKVVLRDLVALRQVGVEVVLAVEFAEWWNHTVERNASQDRRLNSRFVQHRQRARGTTADH